MRQELADYLNSAADDTKAIQRGNKIIEVLQLHMKRNGRVDTAWGDKTPLGLFRTIERIISGDF